MSFFFQDVFGNPDLRTLKKNNYYDPSNINPIEWQNALLFIDKDIMDIYDKANDIIIISLPYKLSSIKQEITEFISTNFNDESLLNCFDVVLSYLNPNKKDIQSVLHSNLEDNTNDNKFTLEIYDKLIQTEAIIVINPKNNEYISIPRDVNKVQYDNRLKEPWEISWNQLSKYNYHYSEVNDFICDKLANIYFDEQFHLTQKKKNWKGRIDFNGISHVGYTNDDGEVQKGTVLDSEKDKIYLEFDDGRKQWIKIPNEQLCEPPLDYSDADIRDQLLFQSAMGGMGQFFRHGGGL